MGDGNAFDADVSPDPDDAPNPDLEELSAEEATAVLRDAQRSAAPERWDADLPRNAKSGNLSNTFRVLCVILRSSPEFHGRFWWSEMLLRPMIDSEPVTEAMTGTLRERIEELFTIQPTPQNMRAAIISISRENPRHEAKEWLLSLPAWDGRKRLALVPKRVLGTDDDLAPRLFARFCISAVARAFDPGCKADCALVLAGQQDLKKSTFFEALTGAFFSDADIDIQNKDSVLQLFASWITEWGEIERVTSRKDASIVKAWLSRKSDLVRLPYGSAVEKFPRTSVIVGTTNKPDFLNDETGDRRFWVIEILKSIDVDLLLQWREQLWAEAIAAYRAKEPWWLTRAEESQRQQDAKNFRESHPWEPIVETWLRKNPCMDFVNTSDVLTQAIGMRAADIGHNDDIAVGKVMRALGWERVRPRKGNTDRRRGYQKPKPQIRQPAETISDTCAKQVTDDWSSSSAGPVAVRYPVQSSLPHEIQGGPVGPVGSRVPALGSRDASISDTSNPSPSTHTILLDHVDHVDQGRNDSGIPVPLGKPGPVSSVDRAPSPPTEQPGVDEFVAECLIPGFYAHELAVVVASLYEQWARFHGFEPQSRIWLMRELAEAGFTTEGDTVHGVSVRDEWVTALDAAEDALERQAIVKEGAGQ